MLAAAAATTTTDSRSDEDETADSFQQTLVRGLGRRQLQQPQLQRSELFPSLLQILWINVPDQAS